MSILKKTSFVYTNLNDEQKREVINIHKHYDSEKLFIYNGDTLEKVEKFLKTPSDYLSHKTIISFSENNDLNMRILFLNNFDSKFKQLKSIGKTIENDSNLKILNESNYKNIDEYEVELDGSNKKEINISFSIKQLFNMSELNRIYREKGLDAYLKTIKSMESDKKIFKKGKYLDLYFLLKSAKYYLSNYFKINIFLVSKNEPFVSNLFIKSLRKYGICFDKVCFTGGEPRSVYNKMFDIDIVFCSNTYSQYENELLGLNSFNISLFENKIKKATKSQTVGDFIDLINEFLPTNNKISKTTNIEKIKNEKLYLKEQNDFSGKKITIKSSGVKLENILEEGKNLIANIYIDKKLLVNKTFQDMKRRLNKLKNINVIEISNFKEIENTYFDLFISSKKEDLEINDRPIVYFEQVNKNYKNSIINNERPFSFVFDMDEIISKGDEFYYQNFSFAEFLHIQEKKLKTPLVKGNFFNLFYKLSRITYYYKINKISEIDINLTILTSRGGGYSSERVFDLLAEQTLYVDKAIFLNGFEKTKFILNESKKGGICCYLDDQPKHISRIIEKISELDVRNILALKAKNI